MAPTAPEVAHRSPNSANVMTAAAGTSRARAGRRVPAMAPARAVPIAPTNSGGTSKVPSAPVGVATVNRSPTIDRAIQHRSQAGRRWQSTGGAPLGRDDERAHHQNAEHDTDDAYPAR